MVMMITYIIGLVEEVLRLLPILLIKTDVGHAEQALELHPHSLQVPRNPDTLSEVVLCLLDVTLKKIGDGELTMAKGHRLVVVPRDRDVEGLLEFIGRAMVLPK